MKTPQECQKLYDGLVEKGSNSKAMEQKESLIKIFDRYLTEIFGKYASNHQGSEKSGLEEENNTARETSSIKVEPLLRDENLSLQLEKISAYTRSTRPTLKTISMTDVSLNIDGIRSLAILKLEDFQEGQGALVLVTGQSSAVILGIIRRRSGAARASGTAPLEVKTWLEKKNGRRGSTEHSRKRQRLTSPHNDNFYSASPVTASRANHIATSFKSQPTKQEFEGMTSFSKSTLSESSNLDVGFPKNFADFCMQ
ncbi:eac06fb9-e8a8-48d4-bb9d-e8ad64a2ffdd-CDS [Sclerotinia trifoliorum]|uniref:Eac06fb9-e8a8-48d4-bb9d-e8ad64a2ffdd-CDS n=1 Tax=Sclerotinia trifoliorum TaxID=28548 RepID=A0A8H2VY48_9HELO|nr:eac06fb9-e8a8-48d4-bb9d-e8ad64a2ffdd-CDS [Sclerotinia trifoliorum]